MPCHPYEYVVMLGLALVPPAFNMMMNPRLDAIERAKKGIKPQGEEDAWNGSMPLSKADKRRDFIAKLVLLAETVIVSGIAINFEL